jgi:hypothetical protein
VQTSRDEPYEVHARLLLMRWLVVAVGLGITTPAAAQSRVHLDLVPDLELHEIGAIAPGSSRFAWRIGGWARHRPGQDGTPSIGFTQLRWGSRFTRETSVRLRSALRLLGVRGGDHGIMGSLAGSHRLLATAAVGGERGTGADSAVDARIDHTGADRLVLDRISRGPIAYTDARARVRLGLRRIWKGTGVDGAGIYLPIEYEVGRVGYDFAEPGAPVRAATSRGIHIGLGPRFYDRHVLGGWMAYSYHRTTTEIGTTPAAAAAAAEAMDSGAPRIRKTEGRIGARDMTFYEGDKLLVSGSAYYGWTWLRAVGTERASNLFTMKYAFHVAGRHTRVGFGFARQGSHTADGGRLLADWRLEASAGYRGERGGGSIRAVANWINDEERNGDLDPGTVGRYAIHGEAFTRTAEGVEIGLYDVASHGPRYGGGSWDPWMQRPGLAVELGAFIRLRGDR